MATLQVLGCSGGVGEGRRTSSFLLNSATLIDAGTGVGDLSMDALCDIDQVFLTHSHLDHVSHLPFLIDAVQGIRNRPQRVIAQAQTIASLRAHLFNDQIWPDFSVIPTPEAPCMVYQPIRLYEPITVDGSITVTAIPAEHSITACSYHLQGHTGGLVYTGDSICNPEFWHYVNQCVNLKHLIIETSFLNRDQAIADRSFHLTPDRLAAQLSLMTVSPRIWITHLKPGSEDELFSEITQIVKPSIVQRLAIGDRLEF